MENNTKGKMFEKPEFFKRRFVIMAVGLLMQGIGLSILIKINLGTDPCSVFTLGVIHHIPLSFGTAQLLCHLITFTIVILCDRSRIGFGTIGNMCCIGYIADYFHRIWNIILPAEFLTQKLHAYLLLIPGLVIFAVGAALYMSAGLGQSPYDGLPFILSSRFKKIPFQVIRILWDFSFMLVGYLLGGSVGIVTIAISLFFGPIIGFVQKQVTKILL